jgi:beta-galactosidase
MRTFLLALLLLAALPATADAAARTQVPLNSGWRFELGQAKGAERSDFDDSKWIRIEVPHTWNRLGNVGSERSAQSNATQGVGWYRLRFKSPPGAPDTRYFLQFDAVSEIAEVWLNGRYLGKHSGAFARFRFDATEAIRPGADNVLAVRADNSRPELGSSTQDIVPLSGDFFIFGGIYREVSLIETEGVHVDLLDFGGPGLYAHASQINANAAHVQLSARLTNEASAARQMSVEFAIQDASGRELASDSQWVSVEAGTQEMHTELKVDHPRLWQGAKDPYLYRAVIRLLTPQRKLLDEVREPLGLRTMRFDPEHGFFLNGQHLMLKGVSRHQDRAGKGWAIAHADIDEDFALIEDMGANAVRFAHYQHDQYEYQLADRHGLIAWAELPLVNQVSFDGSEASAVLAANAQQQLRELIRQNFNHPSIALWSIGNEVDLLDTGKKAPTQAAPLLRALNALAKQEDPSRSTTLADCCEMGVPPQTGLAIQNAAPRESFAGIADTLGYNRYFGWYAGGFDDLGPMLDAAHAKHPALPLAVSEYGAGGALSQHSDDARGGPINPHGRPHPEEYQDLLHEQAWPVLKARPYLWASFLWNMFDFASPSRHEGDLTDINEKGMVSYDRRVRKDAYYFYRANWNSAPTLHLVGRRYEDRSYAVIDIKAYGNVGKAKLSLNGAKPQTTSCTAGICVWRAMGLKPGDNTLVASADSGGRKISDSIRLTLSHRPGVVRIKAGDISGYADSAGTRYGSDLYFEGGHPGAINPPDTPENKRVTLPISDAPLFETYREGEFSYRIPVPEGRYRIELRFVEPHTAPNEDRSFDVLVNGEVKLTNLDVKAAAGGALKPITRQIEAVAREGMLLVGFQPRHGQALVSALSITPLESP